MAEWASQFEGEHGATELVRSLQRQLGWLTDGFSACDIGLLYVYSHSPEKHVNVKNSYEQRKKSVLLLVLYASRCDRCYSRIT